jgi:hypothetical protein
LWAQTQEPPQRAIERRVAATAAAGAYIDFIRKVGKLTIPSFDGSSKCTARAWVQKLDTYYKLNQMTETKAISFATLHLEGEAHEWWYHGLVTLGHSHITSSVGYCERKDREARV